MFSSKGSRWAWSSAGVALAGLLLSGVGGCGSSEPFDMLPVSGKVTYEDGSLISAHRVRVVFEPQAKPIDPKTHPRPGNAEVNVADGTFSYATTHKLRDGLVLGKHTVKVYSHDQDDVATELEATPSEIEVGRGSTEFVFKVKKR